MYVHLVYAHFSKSKHLLLWFLVSHLIQGENKEYVTGVHLGGLWRGHSPSLAKPLPPPPPPLEIYLVSMAR